MSATIVTFDTIRDLVERVTTGHEEMHKAGSGCASRDRTDTEWTGCTWAEAVTFSSQGWPDHRDALEAVRGGVDALMPEALARATSHVYSVSGGAVNVPLFLSGSPTPMVRAVPTRKVRASRGVRILVPIAASAGVSTDLIVARGAAIAVLVDTLANAGLPAEVWAQEAVLPTGSGGGRDSWTCNVLIQRADQPFDMDRCMFWIAHPGALRRIMFAVNETEPEAVRRRMGFGPEASGYGRPSPGRPDHLPVENGAETTITLPTMDYRGAGAGGGCPNLSYRDWADPHKVATWVADATLWVQEGDLYQGGGEEA